MALKYDNNGKFRLSNFLELQLLKCLGTHVQDLLLLKFGAIHTAANISGAPEFG